MSEFAAHGAPKVTQYAGGGMMETLGYNNRLQMSSALVMRGAETMLSLENCYTAACGAGGENNGNVLKQKLLHLGAEQAFTYDPLNRLKTGVETQGADTPWRQTYVYDRYGNRALLDGTEYYIPGQALTPKVASDSAALVEAAFPKNRWSGAAYDHGAANRAGNLTGTGAFQFNYDGENRLKTATRTVGSESETSSYAYDGEGRRVLRQTSAGTTKYVYDAFGNLAAEYGGAAAETGGLRYLFSDHLGSVRAEAPTSGNIVRHDYLPYGEDLATANRTAGLGYPQAVDLPGAVAQKFTGKKRDAETELDHFGAR